jgi:hypothetical protein
MSRLYRGRKILQGLLHKYAVEQGIIRAGINSDGDSGKGAKPVDIAEFRRHRDGEKG